MLVKTQHTRFNLPFSMFIEVNYGCEAIEAQMFNSNVTCDILLDAIKKQCFGDVEHFARSQHAHLSHQLQHLEDELEGVKKDLEGAEASVGEEGLADEDRAELEAELAGLQKSKARLDMHLEARQAQLDALQEGVKKFKDLPKAVVDLGDDSGHAVGMADKPRERANLIVQAKKTYTLSRRDADSGDMVPLVFTLPADPVDEPDEEQPPTEAE